jgi:hypothetical protein
MSPRVFGVSDAELPEVDCGVAITIVLGGAFAANPLLDVQFLAPFGPVRASQHEQICIDGKNR